MMMMMMTTTTMRERLCARNQIVKSLAHDQHIKILKKSITQTEAVPDENDDDYYCDHSDHQAQNTDDNACLISTYLKLDILLPSISIRPFPHHLECVATIQYHSNEPYITDFLQNKTH